MRIFGLNILTDNQLLASRTEAVRQDRETNMDLFVMDSGCFERGCMGVISKQPEVVVCQIREKIYE